MRVILGVIELKNTLERMLQRVSRGLPKPTQARESERANRLLQEVYALELDGHLLSLPTHKRGWREFFRKTSTPLKIATAGTMIMAGSTKATADQPNEMTTVRAPPSIERRVDIEYVTLNPIKGNGTLKLPGETQQDYYNVVKKTFLKKYPTFSNDSFGLDILCNTFASKLVEGDGVIRKSVFNSLINGYNNYAQIASTIDSKHFPQQYEDALKQMYANAYINVGEKIDIERKKRVIQEIPNDSKFVIAKANDTMEVLIQSVYPNYSSLSIKDKLKINDYFVEINPNMDSSSTRFNPKDFEDHEFNYRVNSGKVIIIPNSNALQQVLTDKSRTLFYHEHIKFFNHWNLK